MSNPSWSESATKTFLARSFMFFLTSKGKNVYVYLLTYKRVFGFQFIKVGSPTERLTKKSQYLCWKLSSWICSWSWFHVDWISNLLVICVWNLQTCIAWYFTVELKCCHFPEKFTCLKYSPEQPPGSSLVSTWGNLWRRDLRARITYTQNNSIVQPVWNRIVIGKTLENQKRSPKL